MATTDNRQWAFSEATRRAQVLDNAYSIYQHKRHENDHIIRTAQAAPPDPGMWKRIATIQPDGSQSFAA